MIRKNNPLICDIESGVCAVGRSDDNVQTAIKAGDKLLKIIYFTDPICSSCWGIEPQLRKLKLEYGHVLGFQYKMGGLLPDWSYNCGGISKPSDVAHHWEEVSEYYDMPIDGGVWLEDPLPSSYPPSIAFKAAQMQDEHKAVSFLRFLREMLFLEKKNIARWDVIKTAAIRSNLDPDLLQHHFEGTAKKKFQEDLELAGQLGVRGFPTLFFVDEKGTMEKVYGTKPYSVFESAVHKLIPTVIKSSYPRDWKFLFDKFLSLTSKEFSELSGMLRSQVDEYLDEKVKDGLLSKLISKNGIMWRKVD